MTTLKFNLCKRTKTLLTLITLLTLGVGQMWATYYYRGGKNSWGATEMTNVNNIYSYYSASSGAHQFKISTSTSSYDYNYTYVTSGYKNTDGTDIGDYGKDNCYCWVSGAHYILIFNPNTSVNSTNKPIICAATALPSAGFESDGNTISYYNNVDGDVQSSALDRADGSTIDLTSKAITSLYLKAFNTKMYQRYEVNLLGASNYHFYYKIHRTADAAGSTGFTEVTSADGYSAGSITWGSFDGSKWRKPTYYVTANQSLLTGLGSGLYTMSYYFTHVGTTETYRLPSNSSKYNQLKWKVPVPSFSTSSCTSNGTGAGTSGDPFKVAEGSTLTLTVSGTQASSDANSSLYAKFGSADYSSTLTYDLSPTTTLQSITVKAKFYNSADDLSGSEQSWTIYYQATAEPSIAISSVSPSPANSGESVTITASRQNAGTANITYQYSTNGSSWTTIGSATSSTTKSWTTPASTSTTTYYLRAQMTYNSTTYTSSNATLKVYGKKTIKVKDTNSWGANFKIHRWGGDASGTEYPGETTNITSAGGQWKQVVLYSSSTDFIFCNGSSTSTADANKTANKTYAGMTDGYCYVIQSGSGASLTLTSTDCPEAPSVTTAAATSIATTSATFNASGVNANNDAITAYGFKWGTTSACSSETVTASNLGAGTTFSASKTGLTNGTTYYYKAYATNGFGTTYGSVQSFRTKYVTTVTLNPQGGTGGTESVTATEGSAMPSDKTAPGKTGYTFGGYYKNTGGSGTQYYSATMTSANNWDVAASTATIHAKWTPITYTIHFNGNGNTSGSMSNQTGVTYDAATTITANAFGRTGYNFAGWATTQARANAGTVDRTNGAAHGNLASTQGTTAQLWAVWTAKQSTLSFDYQTSATGYGTSGSVTAASKATYNAAMPALSGSMPTAANGYAFMGFYSATGGGGTKYYNSDGTSANNWAENTESTTTLYAYYKKAEITNLALDAATVELGGTVGVTPTVSPTPTGTTKICWEVRYTNDNPLAEQPEMTWSANKLTFAAPAVSGTYKIVAILKTGNDCAAGTELSTNSVLFQVAGTHTVTVQYKCGDVVIAPSTSITARPLDWSDDITAPSIFGYTFARWIGLDGVSIKDHANDTCTTATIKIKANYDGKLKAEYVQNDMIYFKNTLGWSTVYVNFYGNDGYWDASGSGNKTVTNRNKVMTRIGETDVWYFDYGAASITPSKYVSFTEDEQNGDGSGAQNFWKAGTGENVVYPARRGYDLADKKNDLGFYAKTPMFVPLAGQTPQVLNSVNSGKANYYNDGYWTKYTAGTGYTLEVYYDNDASPCIQSIPFTSEDELMPMTAVVDLEATSTYRFQLKRDGDVYYGNGGTMTYDNHGVGTGWDMSTEASRDDKFAMCKLNTNASGNYTFNLSYSGNTPTPPAAIHYCLRMEVDYPIANNDYRLLYSDATQTKQISSAIVTKANNSKDTVSFFIRPKATPVLKIQRATVTNTGDITWNEYSTITSSVTGLPRDSVYNICLTMNGSGAISVENVEAYTGNFYIRTNAAGSSKWDNYRSADHMMTYSEYSEKNADFSHYFMAYVGNGTNVKFVVANDYAPNISDTVIVQTYRGGDASHVSEEGDIQADANVRFMWNRHNNGAYRAYLAAAKNDGSKFLVLRANSSDDLKDKDGNALLQSANEGQAGYNHKAPDNSIQFTDDENWIYETTVKVTPSAYVKLYANFHGSDFYYKGENNNTFDGSNAIQLMTGTGDAEKIRVIYDFKTDRLVSAWEPSGNIDTEREINADVMFVREHQEDITQLTFSKGDGVHMGAITKIETAYGVLRFNKWTLNNKDKSSHTPLGTALSPYERGLYFISFPFRVSMNEVFGFGKYGQHWIIRYYDGEERAATGYWADNTKGFWKYVWDRKGQYFEPNKGYIIALDLDELGESSSVWDNGVENVELYFPSYGTMGDITNSTVVHNLPSHAYDAAAHPGHSDDRTIKDSHWNVMSVPTYVNTSSVTFANTTWTASKPNFLYEWNMSDNTLTARSGTSYTYHAMHAYMVQYGGNVTWTSTSVTPAGIAARRSESAPKDVEFRLELSQNEQMIDQTFVRMSDDEVSAEFVFGEDMAKEFNKNKANIYSMVSTMLNGDLSVTETAGNTLPMSDAITYVPVGVTVPSAGEYTFAMPAGTSGVGVKLYDNLMSTYTDLSAGFTYAVELSEGTHDGRFVLEISPVKQVVTGVEEGSGLSGQDSAVRKVMIDGILYIVKGNQLFDARGVLIK